MPRAQVLRKERGENTKEHAAHSQETTKVGRIQPVHKEVIRRNYNRDKSFLLQFVSPRTKPDLTPDLFSAIVCPLRQGSALR